MALKASLLLGVFATAVHANPFALPEGFHRFAPRANTSAFNWQACGDGVSIVRECSRYEVPLDWHNETAGKASLAVARYPATKQPRLGTLFVNPGGPGGSGVNLIVSAGVESIMEAAGGQFDIVSWDPRGIGLTIPRADCFSTGTEENAFWEGTIPRAGLEARGNFTDQRDLDAFYEQVDEVDVLLNELGQRCVAYSPNTFQYIGTAAAVRDMVAMHDTLEGSDQPIHYWGLSYGTVIGIYFVNMFPDRVGRVVLDGVVDPTYWANLPAHEMWSIKPESTDEAFTGFASACAAAGPAGCAIATADSTTDSIRQWTWDLIDAAYDYRAKAGPSAEVTSAALRMGLYQGMYTPTNWPALAQSLAEVAAFLDHTSSTNNSTFNSTDDNNVTTTVERRSLRSPIFDFPILPRDTSTNNNTSNSTNTNTTTTDDPAPDYAFQGVTCGDAIDAGDVTTKNVFDYLVNVTRTVSQMFGPVWGDAGLYCHRWPVRAAERFTGPWNSKLANPILVIGNEADPVTPYISAKRVADALGDSAVLIEQDDYGHLSLAMHSTCTLSALQDYFLNNKLPAGDKVCGTNQVLFPGPGVTKNTIVQQLNTANIQTTDSNTLSKELEQSRQRSRNLFIAVIALAAATGLLLLSLVATCFRGRKKSTPAHVTHISRGAFEKAGADEQGHTYDDPYTPGTGTKAGGYARVET